MHVSLCSAVVFATLMLAMIMSASSTSVSSRAKPTNTLENPDLSVHNILPSYRTEGMYGK